MTLERGVFNETPSPVINIKLPMLTNFPKQPADLVLKKDHG